LHLKGYEELMDDKKERKEKYKNSNNKIVIYMIFKHIVFFFLYKIDSGQRKWLAKHGKEHLIDFTDKVAILK